MQIELAAANTAIFPGQLVTGTGVPVNTLKTNVNTVTLTVNATLSIPGSATSLSFQTYSNNGGDEGLEGIQFNGLYSSSYYLRIQ